MYCFGEGYECSCCTVEVNTFYNFTPSKFLPHEKNIFYCKYCLLCLSKL